MAKSHAQARLLESLETEVKSLLKKMAKADGLKDRPITDGVVDVARYIASSPKMLWILKEPWEMRDGNEVLGGWSLTKDLLANGSVDNRGTYAPMAYVSYSVFNNYLPWSRIPYATEEAGVAHSLKNIAYINIKKFPGGKMSNLREIATFYKRYKHLLMQQIETINPNIVIGGGTLELFFDDLGLEAEMFRARMARLFLQPPWEIIHLGVPPKSPQNW